MALISMEISREGDPPGIIAGLRKKQKKRAKSNPIENHAKFVLREQKTVYFNDHIADNHFARGGEKNKGESPNKNA